MRGIKTRNNKKEMVKAIRFFDMFSGIGGFRSGLEKAGGFKCIGNCEIDKHAEAAYKAIYNTEGETYYNDARTIDAESIDDFDLITAGFPCQSYADLSVIPIKKRKCA